MEKKIPKILHWIWLGNAPIATENQKHMHEWSKLHPDWQVMVWDDEKVVGLMETVKDPLIPELLCRFESLAARSDILRLFILREIGGVYLDTDMAPVRNIEPLLAAPALGCFVGWEQTNERINNAVIGARRHHPAVIDALNNLRAHIEKPGLNLGDAAHATGPFYLTDIWKHDPRVTKFPKEVFYPYDWHEPWMAGRSTGPDTYAIHRWDASWIREVCRPASFEGSGSMACIMVGGTTLDREDLVVGSLFGQSLRIRSALMRRFTLEELRTPLLYNALCDAQKDGARRVVFFPADHVLDYNFIQTHAFMPDNCIAVTPHRLFSSMKLFPANYRRSDVFPFEVFKFHGFEYPMKPEPDAYLDEVFSLSIEAAHDILDSWKKRDSDTWSYFASDFVFRSPKNLHVSPTYLTRTTKLCMHPVNENAGDAHVPQWDGARIVKPGE